MTVSRPAGWRATVLTAVVAATAFAAFPSAARPLAAKVPDVAPCLQSAGSGSRGELPAEVPQRRLDMLARGVNVTDLFVPNQARAVDTTWRELRRAGIRHVRVPISPEVFADNPPAWQAMVLRRLDQAVCAAVGQGLGIVIDLHPFAPLGPPGESTDSLTARLSQVWRRLAERYARAPADSVFFEIFNEPKLADGHDWQTMQAALASAIRSVAPKNTLIATASPWSTASALSGLTPLADRNVVYAFHFYTPMIFTHQGAEWSVPDYASIDGLAYPAQTDNVAAVARHATADRQAELADYGRAFQNAQPIKAEIDLAADWARRNSTHVVVTEFGVYGKVVPRPARAVWLQDVRRSLEARRIGWTVWEYQGGFGIAGDLRADCKASASAAEALGLCRP